MALAERDAVIFAYLFQAQGLYDPRYYTSVTFKLY